MLSILKRSLKFWLSMPTSFTSYLLVFKILYWRLFQYVHYFTTMYMCAIYAGLYVPHFSSFYKKSQQEQQQQEQEQQLLNL